MDVVVILHRLWSRRRLVAAAGAAALGVGLLMSYHLSILPPKLERREHHLGLAFSQLLIDSPDSQVVAVDPQGADALGARTALIANLMALGSVKESIAHKAGIPSDRLLAVGPSTTDAGPAPSALSKAASGKVPKVPYVLTTKLLTNNSYQPVPIIAIRAQAPDRTRAVALADAAVGGLNSYLSSLAGREHVPESQRLVVTRLGAPQSAEAVVGTRRLYGALAALVLFTLACSAIVAAPALVRQWREVGVGAQATPEAFDQGLSQEAATFQELEFAAEEALSGSRSDEHRDRVESRRDEPRSNGQARGSRAIV
jgi:hypothetical protein